TVARPPTQRSPQVPGWAAHRLGASPTSPSRIDRIRSGYWIISTGRRRTLEKCQATPATSPSSTTSTSTGSAFLITVRDRTVPPPIRVNSSQYLAIGHIAFHYASLSRGKRSPLIMTNPLGKEAQSHEQEHQTSPAGHAGCRRRRGPLCRVRRHRV